MLRHTRAGCVCTLQAVVCDCVWALIGVRRARVGSQRDREETCHLRFENANEVAYSRRRMMPRLSSSLSCPRRGPAVLDDRAVLLAWRLARTLLQI